MQIIDRTRQSMGWNNPFQTRRLNQIRNIGIHHSATNTGNQMVFENHWRTLGWRNGGYSEIILRNGDVEICYVPTTVTNGVSGHNTNTYHICAVGNSNFTAEQERSLLERIRFNRNRFQIPLSSVLGHNEFTGHTSNICPGRNMKTLRRNLGQTNTVTPPSSNALTHTVARGDTLWGIANHHRITVDELRHLNNLNSNLIHPGQVLRLPANSNQIPSNNGAGQIRVGARVRVNQTARTWATGQTIPSWVRGQTYAVQQIRNNNRELLLAGILSWIRTSDVTRI